MKITFIKVRMSDTKGYDALKPLVFSIIAEHTSKDIEIEFIDERIEDIPEVLNSDIIAFSVETFAARRAYELARKYKTSMNKIVMGGFHPTIMPDETSKYCDTVIIGDAEDTWPQFIQDAKEGNIKKQYIYSNKHQLSKIDYNNSCFKEKKYHKIGVVQFSRGCKFNCDFCSVKSFYNIGVRQKDMKTIAEEIKEIKEKILFFVDDNLFLDEESAIELFHNLKPLKKKWVCQISIDIAFKDNLLKAMKESGCFMVLIGFESISTENLKQMNKVANIKIKEYEKAIENIYKFNFMIYGTFVLGYDSDTKESIQKTLDFANENNFAVSNFNPLTVYPKTALYDRLKKDNKLINENWWLDKNYKYGDIIFNPNNLSPDELRDTCKDVRFKFNTYKNIFKRLIKNKANLRNAFVFLIVNIVSRKEIHRKQGEIIGGNVE